MVFAWSVPSHYLNQWGNIVNWTLLNKIRWIFFYQNTTIIIKENEFESVVSEMSTILSQPQCVDHSFLNEVPYNLRTPKLEQPIRRTTNYGLRTFSYLGSKLWNEFLSDFNYTCDTEISELRIFLKQWEGSSLDPSYRNYVCTFIGWSILFGVVDILGSYFYTLWLHLMWFCFSSWVFYVHNDLALYIFCTSSKSYTSLLANVVCC